MQENFVIEKLIDVHKIFAAYFAGCETLAYALSAKLSEGNICLDIEEYKTELPRQLEEQKAKESFSEKDAIFWVGSEEFENQCKAGKFVTHSNSELKPFVIQNGQAYLHRYFQLHPHGIDEYHRWLPIIAAGRLNEGIDEQDDWLLTQASKLLLPNGYSADYC